MPHQFTLSGREAVSNLKGAATFFLEKKENYVLFLNKLLLPAKIVFLEPLSLIVTSKTIIKSHDIQI